MKAKFLILGLLLAIVLLGCPMVPPAGTSAGTPGGKEKSGTVTLALPRISSYLAKAFGVSPSLVSTSGRAILIISRVELSLWLGGETIETMEASPNSGPNMNQPISWSVPSAAGYTVTAKIFNTSVSASTPILYGASDPFEVTAGGTTNVTIRPVPNPPITLAPIAVPAGGVASTTLASCFDTGETQTITVGNGPDGIPGTADDSTMTQPVYSWRDERWFSIDTSLYSAIRVSADPDASSAVYMVVADQTGAVRGNALSGAMGNMGPAYWNWGGAATLGALTGGSRCYVGLITLSRTVGASVNSSVDVSFSPFADDPYEPNNTIETAVNVPKTTVINGIDLDSANTYTWPGTGGDWYKFTLTGADDPNVTVVLEFDMDVSDLALGLYSRVGTDVNKVEESNVSTLSGPTNPAAKEKEQIVRTLAPGVYYLWVHGYNMYPSGNSYRLQWVAGNGTIVIGLQ
jgi:hypothetical protein